MFHIAITELEFKLSLKDEKIVTKENTIKFLESFVSDLQKVIKERDQLLRHHNIEQPMNDSGRLKKEKMLKQLLGQTTLTMDGGKVNMALYGL